MEVLRALGGDTTAAKRWESEKHPLRRSPRLGTFVQYQWKFFSSRGVLNLSLLGSKWAWRRHAPFSSSWTGT